MRFVFFIGNTKFFETIILYLHRIVCCMVSVAEVVNDRCGLDAVQLAYDLSNEYTQHLAPGSARTCQLSAPTIVLQTGCTEKDVFPYLECEVFIFIKELQTQPHA